MKSVDISIILLWIASAYLNYMKGELSTSLAFAITCTVIQTIRLIAIQD